MLTDLTIGKYLGQQFNHNQGLGASLTAVSVKPGTSYLFLMLSVKVEACMGILR